jgi:hypothetical protein
MRQFDFLATPEETAEMLDSYFKRRDCFVVPDLGRFDSPDVRPVLGSSTNLLDIKTGHFHLRPCDLGVPKLHLRLLLPDPPLEYRLSADDSDPMVEVNLPHKGWQDDLLVVGIGTLSLYSKYYEAEQLKGEYLVRREYPPPQEMLAFFDDLRDHFRERLVYRRKEKVLIGGKSNALVEDGLAIFFWAGSWYP